jgi:predicted amidohydrolase
MTLTGFSMNAEKIGEDTKNSPTLRALSEFCKQYHIFAGFGYVEKTQHRFKNRYVIYNESGVIVANYAKIHPFSYGEESYIMLGEIK